MALVLNLVPEKKRKMHFSIFLNPFCEEPQETSLASIHRSARDMRAKEVMIARHCNFLKVY